MESRETAKQRKRIRITYWVATLLFVLPQAWSALQYLIEGEPIVETIAALGYPIYFLKLLAGAKLLGIAAILYGRFPTLKEWAYAGFTFEVIAAILSLASTGDALYIAAVPFAFLVVQLVSYFSWHRLEGKVFRTRRPRRESKLLHPQGAMASRSSYI